LYALLRTWILLIGSAAGCSGSTLENGTQLPAGHHNRDTAGGTAHCQPNQQQAATLMLSQGGLQHKVCQQQHRYLGDLSDRRPTTVYCCVLLWLSHAMKTLCGLVMP
jgi:hypothetical protein